MLALYPGSRLVGGRQEPSYSCMSMSLGHMLSQVNQIPCIYEALVRRH